MPMKEVVYLVVFGKKWEVLLAFLEKEALLGLSTY
jgi:hypothetical protein